MGNVVPHSKMIQYKKETFENERLVCGLFQDEVSIYRDYQLSSGNTTIMISGCSQCRQMIGLHRKRCNLTMQMLLDVPSLVDENSKCKTCQVEIGFHKSVEMSEQGENKDSQHPK